MLARENDAEKGIKALIAYHLKWVERNKAWAQYLFRMRHDEFMTRKENEFAALNKEFIRQVSIWTQRQIAAGAIRRMSPELYSIIVMSPCHEFAREYISGHTSTDINKANKELASAAWLSLKKT